MAEVLSYEKRFRNHWERFLARFRVTSNLRHMVYTDLHRRYGEKHRTYHGIKLPVLLLDELEVARREMPEWFENVEQDMAIELALWDSYIIYKMQLDDKEGGAERVIEHAHDLGISSIVGARASLLVLATKHTKPPEGLAAEIVTDIDLSLLAAPWEVYVQHIQEIREEYDEPEEEFRARHEAFLRGMLQWSGIYSTDYFFMKYEHVAQENLKRSLRETFMH